MDFIKLACIRLRLQNENVDDATLLLNVTEIKSAYECLKPADPDLRIRQFKSFSQA